MSDNPDSRHHDYNEIERGLKSKDPVLKDQARKAKDRLDKEDRETRELRGKLIEAHRYHDKQRIEELHFILKAKDGKYR